MFKTKKYYRTCLAMQINNNKHLNQKYIEEKKLRTEQESMFESKIIQIEQNHKKELKTLKSKVTRLTNQLNKMKEGE